MTGAAQSRDTPARAAVAGFLHHPVTELALVLLIVASVVLLLIETAYREPSPERTATIIAGDIITGLFILELTARLWIAPKKRRFFRRYWVDLLAVLPIARPFRLLRALRLLRLFRAGVLASRRLSAFGGVFRTAGPELTLLGTITSVLVFASAVVLFLVERGSNPRLSGIEETVWFSLYSLIAGEPIGAEPTTGVGRAVTLVVMVGGLTVFGIFVGTISASMMTRLSRRLGANEMDLDELSGHVVVCGWNRAGPNMLRELFSGRPGQVVIVTEADGLPEDVPEPVAATGHVYHLSGDHTRVEVLRAANVAAASAVVVLADRLAQRPDQDRDARTVLAALTLERIAPHVFTCVELTNRDNASLLKMAGVDEIVVPHEYSGVILASVSRNRGLVEVLDEILTTASGNAFHKTDLPPELAGKTVADVHRVLKEKHNAILISLERPGEGKKLDILVNPAPGMQIRPGDRAVVLGENPVSWS